MLDRRLTYFLAVARGGSFSRAAEALHVAQPAVSRQVAQLEAELGVKLLERSPAGVVVTEAGALLVERGGALERDGVALREALAGFGAGERGRLALGYSTSLGYGTAPLLIEGLRRRLPDVEVQPLLLPTPELGRAVKGGTLDLALVRSAVLEDGVDAEVLRRERVGVLMAEDHALAASGSVLELRDLEGGAISLHDRSANAGHWDLLVGACRGVGFEPRLVATGTPFDPGYQALLDGSGVVSLVGESAVIGVPAPLVWRPLRDAPRVPISVLWAAGEGGSAVGARAVAALRAEAAEQGWVGAA